MGTQRDIDYPHMIGVRLTDKQYDCLEKLTGRSGLRLSQVARAALNLGLQEMRGDDGILTLLSAAEDR